MTDAPTHDLENSIKLLIACDLDAYDRMYMVSLEYLYNLWKAGKCEPLCDAQVEQVALLADKYVNKNPALISETLLERVLSVLRLLKPHRLPVDDDMTRALSYGFADELEQDLIEEIES